jgi:hypothetical protein
MTTTQYNALILWGKLNGFCMWSLRDPKRHVIQCAHSTTRNFSYYTLTDGRFATTWLRYCLN